MRNILVGLIALLASPVMAQCKDVAEAKDLAAKAGATSWVEMTHDQLEFVRGIFALDPNTPTGLPPGDKAVLASKPDKSGAVIFFIDNTKACFPIPAPPELIDLIMKIGTGEVTHEGNGT